MLMPNTLSQKLAEGKPTVGTHFMIPDPDIAELIGDTGVFDYAEYAAEYSVLDMKLLYGLARAAQCGNLPLLIKLDQESQGFWAQAALGAGFQAALFTDIRSPADIDDCYQAVRPDTPHSGGRLGVKLRRPAFTGYKSDEYQQHLHEFIIAIMIEKSIAVDNLDTILMKAKNKGVKWIQWGPADFRFSQGLSRNDDVRGLQAIEENLIRRSQEYGLLPRAEISAVEQAERYLNLGVRHFCIGWDRFILQSTLQNLGSELRKLF